MDDWFAALFFATVIVLGAALFAIRGDVRLKNGA